MGQELTIRLTDETVELYRASAERKGSTLQAELEALLEAQTPMRPKDCAALLKMSDEALAMTPPGGPADASDSTLLIRWDRDTQHGKWVDDGWGGDEAGR